MKKLLFCASAVAALLGVSAVPLSANTCTVSCFGLSPTATNPRSSSFGDSNISAGTPILDDFVFSLSGPPHSGSASETTTGAMINYFIDDLELAVYRGSPGSGTWVNSVSYSPATPPSSCYPNCYTEQTLTLPLSDLTAGSYYIEVSGTAAPYYSTASYTGSLNLTPSTIPLPAALPLFAGGLGVIGLLARRRKCKAAAAIAAA